MQRPSHTKIGPHWDFAYVPRRNCFSHSRCTEWGPQLGPRLGDVEVEDEQTNCTRLNVFWFIYFLDEWMYIDFENQFIGDESVFT